MYKGQFSRQAFCLFQTNMEILTFTEREGIVESQRLSFCSFRKIFINLKSLNNTKDALPWIIKMSRFLKCFIFQNSLLKRLSKVLDVIIKCVYKSLNRSYYVLFTLMYLFVLWSTVFCFRNKKNQESQKVKLCSTVLWLLWID